MRKTSSAPGFDPRTVHLRYHTYSILATTIKTVSVKTNIHISSLLNPEKLTGLLTTHEIPRVFWNPKVHNRICKSPPVVPILSKIDQVPALPHPTSQISILMLSSHLRLGFSSVLLTSGFPTKTLYVHLLSPIRATCLVNLILLA